MGKKLELTGERFGRLLVIRDSGKRAYGSHVLWKCKCDCGVIKNIIGYSLTSGLTKSCGCYQKERVVETFTKHGLAGTKLHEVWHNIKKRCNNPELKDYKNYGERGITICDEWKNDFVAFYEFAIKNGWKESLRIDRIDNNGNYEPSNCRFITHRKNCLNRSFKPKGSGYVGVSLSENRKSWRSRINIYGKEICFGTFKTKIAAVIARNNFIVKNNLQNDYAIQDI